jgi:hypothetical protein
MSIVLSFYIFRAEDALGVETKLHIMQEINKSSFNKSEVVFVFHTIQ